MSKTDDNLMEKIVSLCKRRGFVLQSSEIYGGLAGFYDYGHYGVALKNNIKNSWWKKFVDSRRDMYGMDAAILMNSKVWEASGHVTGFSDPMVEYKKCKKRYRADFVETHVEDINMVKKLMEDGMKYDSDEIFDANKNYIFWECESCGNKNYGSEPKQFNMMFATKIGAMEDSASTVYLRPETAQGIFVNFKNTVDAFHPKLPFGIAQIGKAFRNEITARDFIFRLRELEQMEVEYFIRGEDWEKYFEYWKGEMLEWMEDIGFDMSKVHELEVGDGDRAHYSKRTIDFEFDFPFGRKELYGLAYRADFDLKNHKLEYIDEDPPAGGGEKIVPHVIEPSLGVDRAVLALLLSAYTEDEKNGEVRTFLKLKPG